MKLETAIVWVWLLTLTLWMLAINADMHGLVTAISMTVDNVHNIIEIMKGSKP